MLVCQTALPAYNVQTAVDTGNALIVAHAVVLDASDIRCLKPMSEAAKKALEVDSFNVVADAGYSNGEQVVAHCEAAGMVPYIPVMRTVNNQGAALSSVAQIFVMNRRAIPMSAQVIRDCCASTPIIKTVTPCIRLRRAAAELVC